MKQSSSAVGIAILLLLFSGLTFSQEQNLPIQLLGKSVIELKNSESLDIKETLAHIEDDDTMGPVWIYTSNGHSLTLRDWNMDGVIDRIIVDDKYFMTDKIKIGDSLDKVMNSYQDAKFSFALSGLSFVRIASEKLVYIIGTHDVPMEEGVLEYYEDNVHVKKSKVISIEMLYEWRKR